MSHHNRNRANAATPTTGLPVSIPYEAPAWIAAAPTPVAAVATAAAVAAQLQDEEEDVCAICLHELHEASAIAATMNGNSSSNRSNHNHVHTNGSSATTTTTTAPTTAVSLQIRSCRHAFHQDCLFRCMQQYGDAKCPVCRALLTTEPVGQGPSGTMRVTLLHGLACPGAATPTTLQIEYRLPDGTQLSYHDHPNTPYTGARRTAYLPDNADGRALLARLQYAFVHGLVFRLGTSVSTGVANCVVWSSIHHKTSLTPGDAHGYPDAHYIPNCHASLDALHVPPADQCGGIVGSHHQHHHNRQSNNTNGNIRIVQLRYEAPANFMQSTILQRAVEPYKPKAAAQRQQPLPPPLPLPVALPSGTAPHDHGHGPSGTMTINVMPRMVCPGHERHLSEGTIVIEYVMPPGHQQSYHAHPGMPYPGTTRTTYVPNTPDGRALVWRLRYAWSKGLLFIIGTSQTTGATNVICWSSLVSHKSTLERGDEFGYPDERFIVDVHAQLWALNVPQAQFLSQGAPF